MIVVIPNMSIRQADTLAKRLNRPILADGDREAFYLQSKEDTGAESQTAHIERTQESETCHAE